MSGSHRTSDSFTPIIGVLCIDIAVELQEAYGKEFTSYIEASYVKYLESAGARVVPLWINRPRSYYETLMGKINGVLFPGGAVYFNAEECSQELRNDCVQSSKYIFEIAKSLNDRGQHFPLWGTCMGFQLMLTHSAARVDIRLECQPMCCSLPVNFESDTVLASSALFGRMDEALKRKMSSLPFGVHLHRYCITEDSLLHFNISEQWRVLAYNQDADGLKFITIVEHNNFPFYGVQIHPERVGFQNFLHQHKIHHCLECFELAQYFARFFVRQCSLNANRFATKEEELQHSIHNFPTSLLVKKEVFRPCYLFKDDSDYPKEMPS